MRPLWTGGFVKFAPKRHGFLDGLMIDGTPLPRPRRREARRAVAYRGFYRHGKRVVFAYKVGGVEMLDAPWAEGGQFTRVVGPATEHPLRRPDPGRPARWPEVDRDAGDARHGRALMRSTRSSRRSRTPGTPCCSSATTTSCPTARRCSARCRGTSGTSPGSTRRSSTSDGGGSPRACTRRSAWSWPRAGLRPGPRPDHPAGDLDGDGEADFHECVSNAYATSTAGHDFICGLQRDAAGPVLHRLGQARADPDLAPTASPSRPSPPASATPTAWASAPTAPSPCPAPKGSGSPRRWSPRSRPAATTATRAPKGNQPPDLPLVYLPRGLDNSSGGQVFAAPTASARSASHWVHLSFGAGRAFLMLRDVVDGQAQGAVFPLPGEFLSGVHRGRMNPVDGQLYVSGMGGWGTLYPARRLLPAGPLHRRAGPAPRRLPRPRGWRPRHASPGPSTATSPEARGRTSPRPGIIATAPATARRSYRRATPGSPATTSWRSARPTSWPTAGPCSWKSPTSSRSTSSTSASTPARAAARPVRHGPPPGRPVHRLPRLRARAQDDRRPPDPGRHGRPLDQAHAQPLVAPDPRRPVDPDRGRQEPDLLPRTLHRPARRGDQARFANPDVVPHNWALIQPGTLSRSATWPTGSSPSPTPSPAATSPGPTTSWPIPTSPSRKASRSSTSGPPRSPAVIPTSAPSRATGWS